jgi:probable pyridine nucleotide-disulfide oxidoreductase
MKQFDAIIIGFGKGGKTLAAEFAKRGKKVAIIERSSGMYGGTCINIGCIPTKTLVHQAKIASNLKDHQFETKKKFYRNAIEEKERVTTILWD